MSQPTPLKPKPIPTTSAGTPVSHMYDKSSLEKLDEMLLPCKINPVLKSWMKCFYVNSKEPSLLFTKHETFSNGVP